MSPTRRQVLEMGVAAAAGLLLGRSPLGAQGWGAGAASGSATGSASGAASGAAAASGSGSAVAPGPSEALQSQELIRKAVPSSGEEVPVIGLGSAGTFNMGRGDREWEAGRDVIRLFREAGGTVIDTSPTYGQSEPFVGQAVKDFGLADDLFLATKVNVGGAGLEAAFRQMDASSSTLGKPVLDLMQVWNLGDTRQNLTDRYLETHMEAVREWKARGRCRYIGITTSRDPQYQDVFDALGAHEMDWVQLDYSIAEREPEERLLPRAQERGIAVLVNQPFGGGGLFGRVRGRELPEWAPEIGVTSWAQYFLKFVASHPAVTCTIPATSDPEHVVDNMGACRGELPDEAMRQRMVAYFEGR